MFWIVIVVIAVAIVELFVFLAVDVRTGRKKAEKYIRVLDENYESKGVLKTLDAAQKVLPKRCIERAKICEAMDYLENSVLKDYQTAFYIVEKGFPQKNVKEKHKDILMSEQQKANATLLLGG